MCIFSTVLGLECFLPIFVGYNSPATICILPRKFSPICSKFHGIHYTYINVCGCNFWQMLEAVLHTDLKRNLWGEAKTVHKYWNEKMACFMWSGFFFLACHHGCRGGRAQQLSSPMSSPATHRYNVIHFGYCYWKYGISCYCLWWIHKLSSNYEFFYNMVDSYSSCAVTHLCRGIRCAFFGSNKSLNTVCMIRGYNKILLNK